MDSEHLGRNTSLGNMAGKSQLATGLLIKPDILIISMRNAPPSFQV